MSEEFHTACDKPAVYVSNVHTQPSRGIGQAAKSFVYSELGCFFEFIRCEESAHIKLNQRRLVDAIVGWGDLAAVIDRIPRISPRALPIRE